MPSAGHARHRVQCLKRSRHPAREPRLTFALSLHAFLPRRGQDHDTAFQRLSLNPWTMFGYMNGDKRVISDPKALVLCGRQHEKQDSQERRLARGIHIFAELIRSDNG